MPAGWEKEGFLDVRDGRLHIDGVDAAALAREHGTPLFVFSEKRIRHNVARITRAADLIDRPLKVCYAAKAMSTMGILKLIRDIGIDIEVNSGGELWKALTAGFLGDQIIFNGTSKEIWELEMAISNEIYAIQVDSLFELELINDAAARLNKRANVSLRLVPEIETKTHSGLQTALLSSKFGMMPDEALRAFADYKDSPKVDLCGIHLHIGSQNPDQTVYTKACEMLFDTLKKIYDTSGVRLKHINIGGGFPVNYSAGVGDPYPAEIRENLDADIARGYTESEIPGGGIRRGPIPKRILDGEARRTMLSAEYDPAQALADAWKVVEDVARSSGSEQLLANIAILAEPGRSIIADTGICLTSVRNGKKRPMSEINRAINANIPVPTSKQPGISFGISHIERSFKDKSITESHWLLTDAGFNILLSMETYKWYYHLISADRAGIEHDFPYTLAGPLCDGGDVYFDIEGEGRLPEYRLLPKNVEADEVLALLNCGAYSLAQGSQYNGRFLPAVVLIRENGNADVIRRRDSFNDLVNNDVY